MSHERVIFIDEFYSANDTIGAGLIECRAGAFDKDILVGFDAVNYAFENIIKSGVAFFAEPGSVVEHQIALAVDTFFSLVHGPSCGDSSVSLG
jgi:hypothetical protein